VKIYNIIVYTSILIWVLLPFFYRNHQNFYFFLILALIDGIGFVLWNVFGISSQFIWMPFNFLLLVMIFPNHFFRYKLIYLIGFLLIFTLTFFISSPIQVFFCLVVHLVIFLLFAKEFLAEFYLNNSFSIFYLLLLFYEIIMIFKLLAFMRELSVGLDVFYVGTLVQAIVGILLIILTLNWKIREEINL